MYNDSIVLVYVDANSALHAGIQVSLEIQVQGTYARMKRVMMNSYMELMGAHLHKANL